MYVWVTLACVIGFLVFTILVLRERGERRQLVDAVTHAYDALAREDLDTADRIAATTIRVPDLDEDVRLAMWGVHVRVCQALSRHAEVATLIGDDPDATWQKVVRAGAAIELEQDAVAELLLAVPFATVEEEALRLQTLGRLRMRQERYAEAEELLARASDLATPDPALQAMTDTIRANVALRAGDLDHARDLLAGPRELVAGGAVGTDAAELVVGGAVGAVGAGPQPAELRISVHAACAALSARSGDVDRAAAELAQARAITPIADRPGPVTRLLAVEALVAVARGDRDAARAAYTDAVARHESLGELREALRLRAELAGLG